MMRIFLVALTLLIVVACQSELAQPAPTDALVAEQASGLFAPQVDTTLPIPNASFVLAQDSAEILTINLTLTNYALQAADGTVAQGRGHAHYVLNDKHIVPLSELSTEIPADWIRAGENKIVMALNAGNGQPWYLGEDEIGGQVVFSTDDSFPIQSDNITYVLAWAPMSTPIVNDLGYEIVLDEGYLFNGAVQLVACNQTSWRDLFGPRTAYAGHGISAISESRALLQVVESLAPATSLTAASASASQDRYCQLHYLVGGASVSAETTRINGSADTLLISGTYRAPSGESAPFSLSTELAWGGLIALPTPLEASNEHITITITRDLNTLFDGIEFSNPIEAEPALLRTLINHASVLVSP